MNIALFTDSYMPMHNGVAHSVYLLKKGLLKLGHRVCVVRPSIPGCTEVSNLSYFSTRFPFAPEMRISYAKSRYIRNYMKEFKPDIIHTHTEFMLGHCGMRFAKELNCAHVHTYHTIYEDYTHYLHLHLPLIAAKSIARSFSANFCNKASAVITPSDKIKVLLGSYGTYSPVFTIPTGLDLSMFYKAENNRISKRIREKYSVSVSDKILLFVGRISEEKNIDELIYLFSRLCNSDDNCVLMLVGFCENKSKIMSVAKKYSCADKIRLCGLQKYENIVHFYKMCDVFVSASSSETQGLTYIEALASSATVLAKNDKCLSGVINNGYNGITFNNVQEFIDGFNKLTGKNARVYKDNAFKSSEEFSYMRYAQNVEKVYKKVIGV